MHPESTPRHGDGIAILQLLVFVGAGLVAAAVWQFVPWRDPVEVVGLPLVTGYAERAEQMGFYAFFVAAVVGAFLLRPLIARLNHPVWSVFSSFGALSLLGLVAWCRDVNLLPLVLLGGCGSYFGGVVGVLMIRRPIGSWLLWCGGLIVWFSGSPELRGLLSSNPRLLAAVAGLFASVVVLAASRRGDCRMEWLRGGFLAVTLLFIVGGSWLAPFEELKLGLCGAVCWILGAKLRRVQCSVSHDAVCSPSPCGSEESSFSANHPGHKGLGYRIPEVRFCCTQVRRAGRNFLMEATQTPAWLEFVGFMTLLVTVLFWLPGRWQEAVPRMLAGAGAAMSCVALLRESRLGAMRAAVATCVAHFRVDPLLVALMVGTLPLVLVRPWFGVLMVGTVAWLWNLRPSQRPFARHLWLVLLMSLAFLPTSLRAGLVLDEYHDGYALSCLWEFENGHALYSEMFPLRSFEFYAGLLGRTVLPATVEGYLFSLGLLKFMPVAGVTLLSLVWTRSPQWSFATGLLCATLSRLDPRQGMQVFLVAGQLGILVSPRVRLTWTALPCGIAACVGFDAFVTLVAASTITVFLVPNLRKRVGSQSRQTLGRRPGEPQSLARFATELPRRLRTAGVCLAVAVLPFTVVMGVWQGTESALSFWQLLFDYSRHYIAAIGIPVSWTSPAQRFVIVSNLLLLSLFAATTVFQWTSLSPGRQRAWCFLTVAYFFALHRGLGHSDEFHLGDSVYLTFALGAVGVFEIIRAASRRIQPVAELVRVRTVGDPNGILTNSATGAGTDDIRSPCCRGITSAWWKWRNVALLVGVLAAWSTRHASRGPFDLVRYCSSLSSEETFPLPRDEFIAQTVGPNETIWAIERSLAHVANQRHGPTRYPLAHCIVSPSEQRRVVADMRRNPPRLVLWPAAVAAREQWSMQLPAGWERQQRFTPGLPTADVMIGLDSVPSPLRHFIISQHVLRHYRPAEQPGYLVPAEPDFPGFTVIPADLNGPLRCGRLPLRWGESRLSFLSHRIEHSAALTTWTSTVAPESHATLPEESSAWRLSGSIDPREINYLSIAVTVRVTDSRDSSAAVLTIRFASRDGRDLPSEATLFLEADAEPHTYLVPIGCSPAWTWRSEIGRLVLMANPGIVLKTPQVTALRINDLDER